MYLSNFIKKFENMFDKITYNIPVLIPFFHTVYLIDSEEESSNEISCKLKKHPVSHST